jgi:hypothetical protein
MIISLGPKTGHASRQWLLSTSGLGEPPHNGRFGDCCGEDCPFHPWRRPKPPLGTVSVALTRRARADLDCRRSSRRPGFHRAPSLCAARTFLWRNASDHPSARILGCQRAGRAVDGGANRPSDSCRSTGSLVPKGRFELPRGYPHYALNVARLPFRHFGTWLSSGSSVEPTWGLEPQTCCLRNSCSTN